MPSIADLYSTIDSYKRRAADVLSDPQNSLMQMLGYANDRARQYNESLAQASKERGYGPKTQELAQAMAESYNPVGMTTWHGSPHTFNKFDMSKIGTGEGSQAYGHGLYVAQNPNVAKEYQKIVQGPESAAQQYLKEYKTRKEAISALEYGITPNLTPEAKKFSEDAINILKSGKELKGNLYKVDLPDEHIEKMLDWDKPISKQPEEFKQLIQDVSNNENFDPFEHLAIAKVTGQHPRNAINYNPTGEELFNNVSDILGVERNSPEMSNILSNYGLKGVKYLDEQSRAAGEGTRNFVIFDPNLAKIEERNSVPIPQDPHQPNYLDDLHTMLGLKSKDFDISDVYSPTYLGDLHSFLSTQKQP